MRNIFLILCFFATTSYAQKDSIEKLINSFEQTNDTSAIFKALTLAQESKNDSIIRAVNLVYGFKSYKNKDLSGLIKSIGNLKSNFTTYQDSLSLLKHYYYKALYFRRVFRTDSAFYYYDKSKSIALSVQDSLEAGKRLLSMAYLQRIQKDYLGSEISAIEALRYLEPLNEKNQISMAYSYLGVVAKESGNYKEAKAYYKKGYDIGYLNNNNKSAIRYIEYHNSLALCYHAEGDYSASNKVYQNILIDSIKKKYPKRYYKALGGVAYNNFKLGKSERALQGFLEVLKYREKANDTRNLCVSYTILGEFYLYQKNFKKAKEYALKGMNLAKKINNSDKLMYNYLYLSQIESGEKGKAYLRKYIRLSDSLLSNERRLKNQFAKVRYETEKKEIENKTLKAENEKKQLALEKEKQQKVIGWLLAALSLLFIAFGVAFVKNRRKKIAYDAKLKQVEAREKERQQIAKSLHDEVAGDIRMLHKKLLQKQLLSESKELDKVKENVRNLSHQLSSVSFDDVSFKHQIINLVSDYFDASFQINVAHIHEVNWLNVNSPIKRTLFLSIREALQNIDKYAKAKKVSIAFKTHKKHLFLDIIDDGVGFDTKAKKQGIGLKNMKERIEEIDGFFAVQSNTKGTKISIKIPLDG